MLTTPATKPLLPAINRESAAETLRVRLLSIAQQRHAATIASIPNAPSGLLVPP